MSSSIFSSAVLSVILFTLLSHPTSASPTPKLKSTIQDLNHGKPRKVNAGVRQASVSAPPEWICNPDFYDSNNGCDCGCGATDPDCNKADMTLFCQNSPLPADTSKCDLDTNLCVPQDWTCNANWYNTDDGCDCGCGATDPDCNKADMTLFCHNSPLPAHTSKCDLDTNLCVPQDWTCNANWYNTDDGCDCGCGATDPDCNKEDMALFCYNTGLSPSNSNCDLNTNICVPGSSR